MIDITTNAGAREIGALLGAKIIPMIIGIYAAYALYRYFERKDMESEDEED